MPVDNMISNILLNINQIMWDKASGAEHGQANLADYSSFAYLTRLLLANIHSNDILQNKLNIFSKIVQ